MLLKDIISGGYAALQGNIEGLEIAHLTLDSRTCREGALYFAISGTRCDGHDFIEGAFQNGAAAAIAMPQNVRLWDNWPGKRVIIVFLPAIILALKNQRQLSIR